MRPSASATQTSYSTQITLRKCPASSSSVQRCGVGTALLRKAAELSPDGLRLFTFQRNERARSFYEKHGFRVVKFGTSPPPENEPDVEYRWEPETRSG